MGSSQPESQIDSSNLDGVSNPQIGLEYPPVDEEKAIAALRQLHLKVHQVSPGPGLRGEHPKAIAGVWATFRIADDIPAQYRIGLFSEPRTFRALIRFSNGRSFDDRVANVRGMAIKVFTAHDENAPALNQDFLLIDHPIFFARNVQHTLEFLIASSSGTPSAQLAETTHPKLKGFNSIATQSPLKMSYWSTTPYQLGTGAVKYFAYPSAKQDQPQPDLVLSNSENSLREAMTEQLTRQKIGVNFDFARCPWKIQRSNGRPIPYAWQRFRFILNASILKHRCNSSKTRTGHHGISCQNIVPWAESIVPADGFIRTAKNFVIKQMA